MKHLKEAMSKFFVLMALLILSIVFGTANVEAKDNTIYENGIYRYRITDEKKKEVTLIGFEIDNSIEELVIHGKTMIGNKEYTVTWFDLQAPYYDKKYESVKKIVIYEDFEGDFSIWNSFYNVKYYEFKGSIPPKSIRIVYDQSGSWNNLDVIFGVPEGKEEAYRNIISFTLMDVGDESEIKIETTIVSSNFDYIEYPMFKTDGLLCQVIKSGATGSGEVKLLDSPSSVYGYYKLQDTVKYNGYDYKITKLGSRSLLSRYQVITIPDSVRELETAVFSPYAEIIFLSKNIKEIPTKLIGTYYEDNESHLKFIYVPEGVTTIKDNAFNHVMLNKASIILPKSITSLGKKSLYGFKLVTFLNDTPIANMSSAIKKGTTVKVSKAGLSKYSKLLNNYILIEVAKNVTKSTGLSVNKKSININTATPYTLVGTLSKGSNETVFWNSTDSQIFDVSSKGVVNPKRSGTAYAVAYTRTSGLHQIVKVTVTETIIKEGIFSYKVTDAVNRTVRLIDIRPTSNMKKLSIPETVVYNKKTYKVTSVAVEEQDYIYTPVIKETYSNNIIEEVIFPKSVTDIVGYLGELKNIKSITFKGTTTPSSIFNWWADGGRLAFQSIIYVPKGTEKAYLSKLPIMIADTMYTNQKYSGDMIYNVIEVGTTQKLWFIKNGILYRVTKKAGSKSGTVTVHGADVKLKTINVGGTINDGKYSYSVTAVNHNAFLQSYAESITLRSTITKVGTRVFNQRVKKIVWSKNAKTIETYLFGPSMDLYEKYHSVEIDNMIKKGEFYALTSFVIPEGVATIGNVFRYGFENVKTLTIPKSATKIGKYAFDSIQKVEYVKK